MGRRREQGSLTCSKSVSYALPSYSMWMRCLVCNDNHKYPTEQQLLYEVKARINKQYWIDTRDMLADALTKGKASRDHLLQALWHGRWSIVHKDKARYFPRVRPEKRYYFPT